SPRRRLVAKVTPRSARERWAGPTVFRKLYGPWTCVPVTLARGVVTTHSPNRAVSSPPATSTRAVDGVMPKHRAAARYTGSKANGNLIRPSYPRPARLAAAQLGQQA